MDWIVGYGSLPDLFLKKVQKALAGTDTYRALNDRYGKEPNNVEVVFKLAQKLEGRESGMAKTKDLYSKVISLDPGGKSGSYNNEYLKALIPYTEAAEEALGRIAFFGRENDPAPLRAFIAKYPESKFLKDEYALLARFYYLSNSVPKDEASKFFAEYTSKYPYEADVLNSYVERIISDKEPLDKGIELAEKIKEIVGDPPNPGYVQNLAQLHVLKGDLAKAEEEYGKDFMDGAVSSMIYWLTGYANFWIKQNKNLESVEAMADLAAKMPPASQWRALLVVVNIYLKLSKIDKALGIYGPEFVKRQMADLTLDKQMLQDVLLSYATFWSGQGTNFDSALEAARKAVELAPDYYYNNYTLANILYKLKKYDEALKYAEKASELVKPMTVKYQGFPTQQYNKLVKDIKDAQAKEKAPVVKK
jgi:tetratricopeptide (TPR) repeat protein